jgi:hypothetical protein
MNAGLLAFQELRSSMVFLVALNFNVHTHKRPAMFSRLYLARLG